MVWRRDSQGLHHMLITHLVGFSHTWLWFSVLNYTTGPGLDGSCSSAHQPKGHLQNRCQKSFTKPNWTSDWPMVYCSVLLITSVTTRWKPSNGSCPANNWSLQSSFISSINNFSQALAINGFFEEWGRRSAGNNRQRKMSKHVHNHRSLTFDCMRLWLQLFT